MPSRGSTTEPYLSQILFFAYTESTISTSMLVLSIQISRDPDNLSHRLLLGLFNWTCQKTTCDFPQAYRSPSTHPPTASVLLMFYLLSFLEAREIHHDQVHQDFPFVPYCRGHLVHQQDPSMAVKEGY